MPVCRMRVPVTTTSSTGRGSWLGACAPAIPVTSESGNAKAPAPRKFDDARDERRRLEASGDGPDFRPFMAAPRDLDSKSAPGLRPQRHPKLDVPHDAVTQRADSRGAPASEARASVSRKQRP